MLSSMSFQLEWSPPLEEHRNGVIMEYKISVEWGGVDQVYTIETPSTNHYTITGLEQGTTYHYSLAAYTIIGTGPYSNSTAVSLPGKNATNILQITSDFIVTNIVLFSLYWTIYIDLKIQTQ